jgi:hypothetical protein
MSYSAVVLDEKSQKKLTEWALKNIKVNGVRLPILVEREGWKLFCHHMTIQYPGIPEFVKQFVESKQSLDAIALGISDKAIAVRVIGFHSENKIPHITVAVNTQAGGKPMMSNAITNWTKIEKPVTLSGVVKEIG